MSNEMIKYNCIDVLQTESPEFVKRLSENNQSKYSIATFNVKGDLNLGAIIRTSLYFNCKKLYYFRDKRFDRRYCVGSQNYIPMQYVSTNFEDWVKEYSIYPIFIEQGGVPLSTTVLKEQYIKSTENDKEFCLIFGNETNGIPRDIMRRYRYPIISIPAFNVCPRSLSVSMTVGIVLYEISKLDYLLCK